MKSKLLKKAFVKTLPVMAGYIVLGIGFGILLRNAGFGAGYALAMSLFIYAGSMQYVGVGLLTGGASVLSVLLMTVMVNARHLFYSISMIGTYREEGNLRKRRRRLSSTSEKFFRPLSSGCWWYTA